MLHQPIDITQLSVAPSLHWLEAFGLHLRRTPTSKRRERAFLTVDAYLRDVRLFGEYFEKVNGEKFASGMLNATDLKNWLELDTKPATYNRRLASMRMLITWARREGILDYDPSEWIPFANATRKSPRDLSDEERRQFEARAEAGEGTLLGLRDSLIFFLMNDAGLRISEVIGLSLSDLHLDDGYIHVLGKGKKDREVKIGSKLAAKIRTWLDRAPASISGTLITDGRGFSICRQTAWTRFKIIAEQAGVRATPHAMRHTYVYRFMNAYMGGDPWNLPAALDAASQQTGDDVKVLLEYYTRARESEIRAAVEAM